LSNFYFQLPHDFKPSTALPLSLANQLPPPLRRLLDPLLSQEPAAQLIRTTARQQWRLLAVNLGSSVLEALSEGATLAVLLQALQSLGRFANTVSVGTFAAECRARVTARIHSQVPEAIRIQIEQSGQLLVLLPIGAALSDWGEPGLASP